MTRLPRSRASALIFSVGLALTACGGSDARSASPAQPAAASAAAPSAPAPATDPPARSARDLSVDESMGGHTLARHVGKTDAELADRLRRERQISAASTYTDRPTAERIVAAALESAGRRRASWQRRSGRRPNLALHYVDRSGTIGRSLFRGARTPVPCDRALVVLKWDDRRDRSFVLTSYPDCSR